MKFNKAIICFLSLFLSINPIVSIAHGDSREIDYILSERCGKKVSTFFNEVYGNGLRNTDEYHSFTSYRNHYNNRLNKCFLLLTTAVISKSDRNRETSTIIALYDFNENREYGSYYKHSQDLSPFTCNILDDKCNSEEEWNALIIPYMGE